MSDFEVHEGLTWGWRVVNADFTSTNGYRWPWPGNWAECDPKGEPFTTDDPCPSFVGDGLCIAVTPEGAASGGIPLHTVLVVGYYESDVLGRSAEKLRVKRAFVLDVWDAWAKCRTGGAGANLTGANLTGAYLARANLAYANLAYANLTDADLTGAYLAYANLTDAYLAYANLAYANLTDANLTYAYLAGADLTRADLTGADLTRADLTGADLTRADLTGADLTRAYADSLTAWPTGCDPVARGVIIR